MPEVWVTTVNLASTLIKSNRQEMSSRLHTPSLAIVKLGWVHPRVIESLKGLTRDQLDGRRKAGKYIEGEHWIKDPVGSIMWHFENLDQWIEGDNRC